MNHQQFEQRAKSLGYDSPAEHFFEPGKEIDMHTHDFSAMLLVTEGEFRLVLEDGVHTYGPGESCELTMGTLHTEKTGPDGAHTLLARRNS